MVDIQVATKASNLLLVSFPAQTFHMLCRKIVCGCFQYVGNLRPSYKCIDIILQQSDCSVITPTITDLTCMLTGPSFPIMKSVQILFFCGAGHASGVVL